MFKNNKLEIILVLITCLFVFSGISQAAEQVVRTIKINYPSKDIEGSTTVVTVPGCRYDFTVVGDLPAGTWIEWRDATTTKGKWVGSTLYPYETGGGGGTYSITAVLCGGAGPGPGWQVTVSGVITDPVLTFSEPGIDQYFIKDQTDPKPEVDMKVSVVKPDGTKLEGVNVIFVAQKASDGTIVNIGSQSSTTGGIAAKIWDVPVSSVETFTLYASTGGVWPNLENKATGKKAIIFTVDIKAEDGISYPPEYIYVGKITKYKAKVLPEEVAGEFKWEVISGKKYADIVGGETEQTVSVQGKEPSVKGEKVKLLLTFTPSGVKKGFEIEHEFVVVKVVQSGELWWFNGEDAAYYDEVVTLTAQGLATGTFKWDVIGGLHRVNFENDQDTITLIDDNTVAVKSTAASSGNFNDVTIKLTYNDKEICQYTTYVYAPYRLVSSPRYNRDVPDGIGYTSIIAYEIKDNRDRRLDNVWVNEWLANFVSDYPNETWEDPPGVPAFIQKGHILGDEVGTFKPGLIPPVLHPQKPLGDVKVQHLDQSWYVGSYITTKGRHVQSNKVQMYQDHGRHYDIVSP